MRSGRQPASRRSFRNRLPNRFLCKMCRKYNGVFMRVGSAIRADAAFNPLATIRIAMWADNTSGTHPNMVSY